MYGEKKIELHKEKNKFKWFYLKCACRLNRKYINWFRICCRHWWLKWKKKIHFTLKHITFKWLLNCEITRLNVRYYVKCFSIGIFFSPSPSSLTPSQYFAHYIHTHTVHICFQFLFASDNTFFFLKKISLANHARDGSMNWIAKKKELNWSKKGTYARWHFYQ